MCFCCFFPNYQNSITDGYGLVPDLLLLDKIVFVRPCVQEKCPSKKQSTQGLIYRTIAADSFEVDENGGNWQHELSTWVDKEDKKKTQFQAQLPQFHGAVVQLFTLIFYSINTHFDASANRQLLKTLWEKKKLLVQILVP